MTFTFIYKYTYLFVSISCCEIEAAPDSCLFQLHLSIHVAPNPKAEFPECPFNDDAAEAAELLVLRLIPFPLLQLSGVYDIGIISITEPVPR